MDKINESTKMQGEVYRLEKGDNYVIVRLVEYRCNQYIDIREYYYPKDSNELSPTKKGVRINTEILAEMLGEVINSLDYETKREIVESIDLTEGSE